MRRRWINPIINPKREKQVRQRIDRDLVIHGLTFRKRIKLKPAYIQRLTRIFQTITMLTEVQEV